MDHSQIGDPPLLAVSLNSGETTSLSEIYKYMYMHSILVHIESDQFEGQLLCTLLPSFSNEASGVMNTYVGCTYTKNINCLLMSN